MTKKSNWLRMTAAGIAALALSATGVAQVPRTQAAGTSTDVIQLREDGVVDAHASPQFTTDSGGVTVGPNATTIPHYSSSFVSAGVNYPYTFVGNNPVAGGTVHISALIIPIKFVFDPAVLTSPSNSPIRDGSLDVQKVISSPMFSGAQYGDGVMQSTFTTKGTNYHVLLDPSVGSTVTINVPKNQSALVRSVSSRVDAAWWSAREKNLISSMHIPATTLPIFLMHNVYLYDGNDPINNCCILGWHGAMSSLNGNGKQQVNTYMFASYFDHYLFTSANVNKPEGYDYRPIADVHGLSHEVAEWLQDPFVHNIVPAWKTPTAPQYGCSNLLEAGDPLVGYSPNQTVPASSDLVGLLHESTQGYHPQEIPIAPWFMRQSPATSLNGNSAYTFPNTGLEVDSMINARFTNAGVPSPLTSTMNWENFSQGC